jgi:hypothetical protein
MEGTPCIKLLMQIYLHRFPCEFEGRLHLTLKTDVTYLLIATPLPKRS